MSDAVAKYFDLTGKEKGNVQVTCPLHDDDKPSASINFEKKLFNCFGCGEGMSFKKLEERLELSEKKEKTSVPDAVLETISMSAEKEEELAFEFLESRGFPEGEVPGVDLVLSSEMYGTARGYLYLVSPFSESFVGRKLTPGSPKYLNEGKESALFVLGKEKLEKDQPVWITEGILDAASLYAIGIRNVAATLGANPSDAILFPLRGHVVFILYDSDYAGWRGARDAATVISEFGGNPIILDMPEEFGKDPNDALVKNRERFEAWIKQQEEQFKTSDERFVERYFSGVGESLQILQSGIEALDEKFGGGFKTGVHLIGGEPAIGKTSFITNLAVNADKRVLLATYEIPKAQYWARIAAIKSEHSWPTIETTPTIVEEEVKSWVEQLASRIRVVAGWSANKIAHASKDYDVVIVDYVQRMPNLPGNFSNEERSNVGYNIKRLGDIAQMNNRVVIAVSQLNRAGYQKGVLESFYGDSALEYVVSSASIMQENFQREGGVKWKIIKNTRGETGSVYLLPNLGHTLFVQEE